MNIYEIIIILLLIFIKMSSIIIGVLLSKTLKSNKDIEKAVYRLIEITKNEKNH